MPYGDKPFGLRQIRLVRGASVVELPGALTLSFKERTQNGELRGDDKLLEIVAFAEAAEWEIEKGGISLDAYALMTGRTVTTSGVSPNGTTKLKGVGGDAFPYFKNGEFFMTKCSGIAVDDGTNGIYEFVQNETTTALPAT